MVDLGLPNGEQIRYFLTDALEVLEESSDLNGNGQVDLGNSVERSACGLAS